MRKKITVCFLILFSGFVCQAQQWLNNGLNIYNQNSGNVGIGISTPLSKLSVVTSAIGDGISLSNSYGYVTIKGNAVTNPFNNFNRFEILGNTSTANGPSVTLVTNDGQYPFRNGSVNICSYGSSGTAIYFTNYNTITGVWDNHASMTKDGKFIIGNSLVWNSVAPGDYKLYVERGILAERVKVAIKTTANWSDHVFYRHYKLMPLAKLENFISVNKHLPNIPSAEKAVKEGVDLGEMNAKLLEKIEELTLYIIDLNKKFESQQKEIEALKKSSSQK